MEKLLEEIAIEKEHINETIEVLQEASNRSEKTVVELTAIGASLHHFNSLEEFQNAEMNFGVI